MAVGRKGLALGIFIPTLMGHYGSNEQTDRSEVGSVATQPMREALQYVTVMM
jgi:hypothetical protein